MSLRCNTCWEELHKTAYLSLSCSHIFCVEDARKHFSKEPSCPVCDTPVTSRSGLKRLDLTTEDKLVALCGLSPAKNLATKAVEFWTYQKQNEIQFLKLQAKSCKSNAQQIEKSYTEKLVEFQNRVNVLEHQNKSLRVERESEQKELQELQDKYMEKCRQKRKLGELYENLKRQKGDSSISSVVATSPVLSPRRKIAAARPARNSINTFSTTLSSRNSIVTMPARRSYLANATFSKPSAPPESRHSTGLDRFSLLRQPSRNQQRTGPTLLASPKKARRGLFESPRSRPKTPVFDDNWNFSSFSQNSSV